MIANKLYNKRTYKEDMKFQKHLSLRDYQGSGVSAHYESRRSMGPNSPWIFTCTKENLRYITLRNFAQVRIVLLLCILNRNCRDLTHSFFYSP